MNTIRSNEEMSTLKQILEKKNLGHEGVRFWMGAVSLPENVNLKFSKKIDGKKMAFLTYSQRKEEDKEWSLALANPHTPFPFVCGLSMSCLFISYDILSSPVK